MPRIFDHVDLRARDLAAAAPFYQALLPALGFTLKVEIEGWLQFEAPGDGDAATEFFGVTEDREHRANRGRIAFSARSREHVERLAELVARSGARNIEGPGEEGPGYHAVYFDDPSGNPLEICHREKKFAAVS